jgi:AcrR family transcriptional regulator
VTVEALGAKRARLIEELRLVDDAVRDAAVADVQSGRPIAVVAREAGVTRPTLYAWLKSDSAAETRLAKIDARYERLIELVMKTLDPAGDFSRKGNWRSGLQWEQNGRKGSARDRLKFAADQLLARLDVLEPIDRDMIRKCAQEAGFSADTGDILTAVVADLDEAYTIRKRLEAASDPFAD